MHILQCRLERRSVTDLRILPNDMQQITVVQMRHTVQLIGDCSCRLAICSWHTAVPSPSPARDRPYWILDIYLRAICLQLHFKYISLENPGCLLEQYSIVQCWRLASSQYHFITRLSHRQDKMKELSSNILIVAMIVLSKIRNQRLTPAWAFNDAQSYKLWRCL